MPVIGGRNELLSLAAGAGQYAQAPTGQPAGQPPGEVVDPRQRRGAGGSSNGVEEGLEEKAPVLEGSSVVTFMPPSIAPKSRWSLLRVPPERRNPQFVIGLLSEHSRPTDVVLAGLPNEHATVTKRDATFCPGMTLRRPYVHELAPKPVFENLRRPKGVKRYHAGFGPQR